MAIPHRRYLVFVPVITAFRYKLLSIFEISGKGVLTWTFNSSHLPDSLTDVNGSKGFIVFSVHKNTGWPSNSKISNTASIHFDYNKSVVTNTVSDTESCIAVQTDITRQSDSLVAPAGAGSYQWYLNDVAISGATGSVIVPAQNGNYMVHAPAEMAVKIHRRYIIFWVPW